MLRKLLPILLLAATSSAAFAIVIRHDVDDAQYRIPESEFPALVDMPGQGHGVLIAPQWVVTVAHTILMQGDKPGPVPTVRIGGQDRAVARVVFHPGDKRPSRRMIDQALITGDWILAVMAIASSDDIALIKLKQPVTDIAPVPIYKGNGEIGQTVTMIGKGATGNGQTGIAPGGSQRTELRRAFNVITSADARLMCHMFDPPATALPLEGRIGSGDSGGPALIQANWRTELAGLASWGFIHGDPRVVRQGLYGQQSCYVRLSHYVGWINGVMKKYR
jgi:hypothetical protein